MAIHNCENLYTLATPGPAHLFASLFGRSKHCIDNALALVDLPFARSECAS